MFYFQDNLQKILQPELLFLDLMHTISFVGWGFAPDPTEGAYSAPQTLWLYLGACILG